MTLYYDFSALLFVLTLAMGFCLLIYRLFWGKKDDKPAPLFIEILKSVFPIVLVVFVLRAAFFEPFRIPSGSMKPTLFEGDFILVNKYAYGLRLPLFGTKILSGTPPKRGDIMVFRFPKDISVDFIKRVVGVPGDKIRYENKVLYVNDVPMEQSFLENTADFDLMSGQTHDVKELTENLNNKPHKIWLNFEQGNDKKEIVVPEGHYFTMGDNRDYSDDSRYWGFVPDELILGKADYIWMSWDFTHKDIRWKRIGTAL